MFIAMKVILNWDIQLLYMVEPTLRKKKEFFVVGFS
jgi:hypothetical protein